MSPKGPPSPNLRWAEPPPKRRAAAMPMIKNVRLHKKRKMLHIQQTNQTKIIRLNFDQKNENELIHKV
jgi:hypothetical protein